MNLFYAMGGGFGHLQRVRTLASQFVISPFKVITNNPLTPKIFGVNDIIWCRGENQHELVNEIQMLLHSLHFDELFIDSFPAGLFGELKNFHKGKLNYLARRLKWNMYTPLLENSTIHFNKTFNVEELEAGHMDFIRQNSNEVKSIALSYPEPKPERIPRELIPKEMIWLIVHSFIAEEVEALTSYAKDVARMENKNPNFVVITDQKIDDPEVNYVSYFPANDWYPLADRIFTGAGYNTLQEAKYFTDKLTILPFPRRYDDQVWRAKKFNSAITEPQSR